MCFPSLRNQNPMLPAVQCLKAVALYILSCFVVSCFLWVGKSKASYFTMTRTISGSKVWELNFENEDKEQACISSCASVKTRSFFPAQSDTKGIFLWAGQLTIGSSFSGLTPHARIHGLVKGVQDGFQHSVSLSDSSTFVQFITYTRVVSSPGEKNIPDYGALPKASSLQKNTSL